MCPDAPQGKYVVLFFYPLDFTFVCPTEITAFSDKHAQFAAINTEVRPCRILQGLWTPRQRNEKHGIWPDGSTLKLFKAATVACGAYQGVFPTLYSLEMSLLASCKWRVAS